jgi:hypothetical protein
MSLRRRSCYGLQSKAHALWRGLLVGILLVLLAVSSTFAWSKANVMDSSRV